MIAIIWANLGNNPYRGIEASTLLLYFARTLYVTKMCCTGCHSELCRFSFSWISTACFNLLIWKLVQMISSTYPMLELKHKHLFSFNLSNVYREPETQHNARPFGSSMAERQRFGCLDTWSCNCKQRPSLRSPIFVVISIMLWKLICILLIIPSFHRLKVPMGAS